MTLRYYISVLFVLIAGLCLAGSSTTGDQSAMPVVLAVLSESTSTSSEMELRRTQEDSTVLVGSKLFTESVILGEIVQLLALNRGYPVSSRFELGGTRFVWNALLGGDIDVYAEYSGTLSQEIFGASLSPAEIADSLRSLGILRSKPLGFNNTYALGIKRSKAKQLGLTRISDLVGHPELKLSFSNEFLDRTDGWRGLKATYGLPHLVNGLDHSLAYRGIENNSIDVIDLYSTDAEIEYYDLIVLEDDRQYFPRYDAIYLYRRDLIDKAPDLLTDIELMAGRITEPDMVAMNAAVKLGKLTERAVASSFLFPAGFQQQDGESLGGRFVTRTREHLELVVISMILAILVAIPLGIAAAKVSWLQSPVLGVVAILYTIPALALLVFMIPILGIGAVPAIAALFLYSLLPMVRNTYEGIVGIPASLRETADSLGLAPLARLWGIDLPLASRSILAGVKTSAVINIGTATLGALIGAGGYGQPILTGIRLDDTSLILEGAVPAAALAVATQGLLELAGRWLIPAGLQDDREEQVGRPD